MTSIAMNSTVESLPKTGWALQDLADAMGAQVDGPVADVTIERVSTDTRTLGAGDLFVALDGANARGLDVTSDQYPYAAGSTGLSAAFPKWSLAGGYDALRERLEDLR